MTAEALVAALKKATDGRWKSKQQPVLLSNLPPILVTDVSDYKEFLGQKSLKQFIKETAAEGGYKLLEHPTQKAKLALLPVDADFEFPDGSDFENLGGRGSEKALVDFLRALKRLPANELAEVQIPVSVLVKLVK